MRVLVTGSTGFIGTSILQHLYGMENLILAGLSRVPAIGNTDALTHFFPVDITKADDLEGVLNSFKPNVIVHTAANSQVDSCENDVELCYKTNLYPIETLVTWCRLYDNVKLIFFSSDFVFSGDKSLYHDLDERHPVSVYGTSKMLAENLIVSSLLNYAIVRPILVYGVHPEMKRLNILTLVLENLRAGKKLNIVADQFRMPTCVDDVALVVKSIINNNLKGYFNVCGPDRLSVFSFSRQVAEIFNLDANLLEPVSSEELNQIGRRPANTGFDNTLLYDKTGVLTKSAKDCLAKIKMNGF